jgi:endonuclease/exonuclease/phosphatase family metal-dependent hydrolase
MVLASAWYKASLFGQRDWRPVPRFIAYADGSAASVATYNVWFENEVNDVRYPAIAKLVAVRHARVVCLQKIDQSFLRHLKANMSVRAAYTRLGVEGETIRDGAFHRCLMLVNRKTLTVTQGALTDLPATRDQRRCSLARISGLAEAHIQGIHHVKVATPHLDSTGADYAVGARRA